MGNKEKKEYRGPRTIGRRSVYTRYTHDRMLQGAQETIESTDGMLKICESEYGGGNPR